MIYKKSNLNIIAYSMSRFFVTGNCAFNSQRRVKKAAMNLANSTCAPQNPLPSSRIFLFILDSVQSGVFHWSSEIWPIFKQLKKIITPKFLNFHLVHPLTSYNPIIDSSAEGWICGTPRYFITCKRLIANLHVYLHITLAG